MKRNAGFPMYDFAEIRSATDQFWHLLRGELDKKGVADVPLTLDRPQDLPKFWSDENLLLGQTCGYPLTFGRCGDAQYVATPCYTSRFGHGPYHKSLIIVRRGSPIRILSDAIGKICAINMIDSNTGMNLLRLEIAKLKPQTPFFSHVYETSAHRQSMLDVAHGKADIAAIDCITFAHIEKLDPALILSLNVIAETEETPALPFITAGHTDPQTLQVLRESLHAVVTDPRNASTMEQLMLVDITTLDQNAYQRVCEIENEAIALGYPALK